MANVSKEHGDLVIADLRDLFLDDSPISTARRAVDIVLAALVLPIVVALSLAIILLNLLFNPGPLLFSQIRMGVHGRAFRMWKFRTMLPAETDRGPDDAVEDERITSLGRLMRRTRLDELPNFYNVLIGQMSFIGPRPDTWDHAVWHSQSVPHYAKRFRILPGITGLAQVRNGYADCERAIRRKARLDAFYVANQSIALDIMIILCTFRIVLTGQGAK